MVHSQNNNKWIEDCPTYSVAFYFSLTLRRETEREKRRTKERERPNGATHSNTHTTIPHIIPTQF